jgi:cell division transport system permease protein
MNLHPLRYLAAWALRAIRASWTIHLAATGSIAVALLLVGLVALGALNLGRVTGDLGHGLRVIAYLRPDAPAKPVAALQATLARHPAVAAVQRVSPAEAHRRLRESLGNRQELLDGVDPSFLPASLELTLREGVADHVRPVLALLSSSPLVEEVDHMGQWVRRLTAFVSLLRTVGIVIALVVCLACLYIVGSTIRLGVFARRDEISVLKLVGATDTFVHAPFLLQGALQGLCGALAASALLYGLYLLAAPPLEQLFATALSQPHLGFFSPLQLLAGVGGGILLGLLGSRVALTRHAAL